MPMFPGIFKQDPQSGSVTPQQLAEDMQFERVDKEEKESLGALLKSLQLAMTAATAMDTGLPLVWRPVFRLLT